jgi:hypothetical protein
MERRLESLRQRHAKLELALASELARPSPDALRINTLKRRKLWIKDELARSKPPQSR